MLLKRRNFDSLLFFFTFCNTDKQNCARHFVYFLCFFIQEQFHLFFYYFLLLSSFSIVTDLVFSSLQLSKSMFLLSSSFVDCWLSLITNLELIITVTFHLCPFFYDVLWQLSYMSAFSMVYGALFKLQSSTTVVFFFIFIVVCCRLQLLVFFC